MKKFGGKGASSKEAEEATLNWLSTQGEMPVFEGDIVKAIEKNIVNGEGMSVCMNTRLGIRPLCPPIKYNIVID